ncbi:DNA polymerase III subunit chi [Alteromonadaceae bacterium BrNp21-10]|nr:DNA polymerase III subunit chi [Alteromonadaceae bacterium BrNp21-10]
MANVTFYLLDQEMDNQQQIDYSLACRLATDCYRQRQRCLILTADKAQAEIFDELLWQQPTDSFVPHNLANEGPANGAPVEINWQSASVSNRPVLINLSNTLPENNQRFRQIYDFVPAEEQLKQQARERYKLYRAAGHQLSTAPANEYQETNNG